MKLGYVVLQLRIKETRFEDRIGGAAALQMALDSTLLDEMMFVIQLSDDTPPNEYDSSINQLVAEKFGVIVALKMDEDPTDETGIKAFDKLHDVREEIFGALLGWQMPGAESLCYYRGGNLLDFNRAWLWYQFEFEVETRLTDMVDVGVDDLGRLQRIYAQYVLGLWDDSEAAPLEGVPPYLPIDEYDAAQSNLRLVDMKQMVQEEE
jgi:hypothetical protein